MRSMIILMVAAVPVEKLLEDVADAIKALTNQLVIGKELEDIDEDIKKKVQATTMMLGMKMELGNDPMKAIQMVGELNRVEKGANLLENSTKGNAN